MEFSYLGNTPDPANATEYTFSSESFGAADAGRYIVATVSARKSGGATTLASVTIGGVSATIVEQINNTASHCNNAAIAIAKVPTGTSGDIVVTWNDPMVRCTLGVYRLVGIDSPTPADSSTSTANDPTYALDVPAGGAAIGVALTADANSCTWSGLTEDFDGTLETYVTYTGASGAFESEQTDLTCTANFVTSVGSVGCFASWAPAAASETASVSPLALQIAPVVPTPTISVVKSASVSPLSIQATTVVPTPTAVAVKSASVSPILVQMTPVVPTPTASIVKSATASPIPMQLTAVVPTPTYLIVKSASVVPVATNVSIPSVTAIAETAANIVQNII